MGEDDRCPGFGQDRVNFHQNSGRDTAGRADPTWPNRAGYSIPRAVMLGSGGGELGGGNTLAAREHAAAVRSGRAALWVVRLVLCFLLICVVVVPVHFVCCSVKMTYPDPPVSACFFLFSSAPQWGEGRPRGAFVAGCSQTITTGKANKADILLGVCYRPPNQDEETDEVFYKQLAEVSQSLALVLMGDFNLPDACWKYNTAERKQSRRFLECVEDNFLT